MFDVLKFQILRYMICVCDFASVSVKDSWIENTMYGKIAVSLNSSFSTKPQVVYNEKHGASKDAASFCDSKSRVVSSSRVEVRIVDAVLMTSTLKVNFYLKSSQDQNTSAYFLIRISYTLPPKI